MPEFDYSPTVACNYNMSRNEVIKVLQDELTLLRSELESRDKIVAELISHTGINADQAEESGGPYDPGHLAYVDQVLLLKNLEVANQVVHDTLRPVAADVRRRMTDADKLADQRRQRMSDFDREQDRRMMEQTKHYSG